MKKFLLTYLLILPAFLLTIFFNYLPMSGISMAFMDYDIFKGFDSDWVGFKNIIDVIMIQGIDYTKFLAIDIEGKSYEVNIWE